jgi:hypothetical protein
MTTGLADIGNLRSVQSGSSVARERVGALKINLALPQMASSPTPKPCQGVGGGDVPTRAIVIQLPLLRFIEKSCASTQGASPVDRSWRDVPGRRNPPHPSALEL